jgi:NAD(P)H dehydrogenase (quinone)
MSSLIITAHPSSHGFTHEIAHAYVRYAEKHGKKAHIIDLYAPEWKLDFLAYEATSELKDVSEKQKQFHAAIEAADEIVFIFPIWWVSVPAILKNFFDCVFTSGFAYKYKSGGMFPEKLLRGKTAKVFCTCDAIGWMYWLIGNPLRITLQIGIFGWCGLKLKLFQTYDQMRKKTPEERKKILTHITEYGT